MRKERKYLMREGMVVLGLTLALAVGCSSKKKVADNDELVTRGVASEQTLNGEMTEPPVTEAAVPMVHFEFDSASLNADSRRLISDQAEVLRENPRHTATIIGGADERGTEEYNYRLGLRRANAVRAELVRMGIDTERLQVRSVGETQAIAFGPSEESWAMNRRAEIHVNPPDRMALK